MKDVNEWVLRLSVQAWHMAKELEVNCERSGLDCYMQAQAMLCAASDPAEIALWSEVWDYVQTLETVAWNDRILVVLETQEGI